MYGLLNLHAIASARGDGLHPLLRAHLEERALRAASGIVELSATNSDGHVQAGPCPNGKLPAFLPGNVVPMEAYRREARQAGRKTSSS